MVGRNYQINHLQVFKQLNPRKKKKQQNITGKKKKKKFSGLLYDNTAQVFEEVKLL